MSDVHPERLEILVAWEMRKHWALLNEVVVAWPGGRVRGYVEHVAPSGAFALVWDGEGTVHVPLALLPSVRRPHFSEPLDGVAVAPPVRERLPPPLGGQLSFGFDLP